MSTWTEIGYDDSEVAGMGTGRQKETADDDRRSAYFGQERQLGNFSGIIYGNPSRMDKSVSSEIVGQVRNWRNIYRKHLHRYTIVQVGILTIGLIGKRLMCKDLVLEKYGRMN